MTEIKQTILINAPVTKVFDYASDFKKWPEFFEGLSGVRPLTKETYANGAKFIYKVKMMGMKVTVGTEFRQFRENDGWIGKSFKGLEHQTQWIFKDANGSTEFTYVQKYAIPFYMGGKLIDKLFLQTTWEKIIDRSLQNLKRLMEEIYNKTSR